VSGAGLSIWLDIRSRDLVESDRFGRYVRRYPVNGAALVIEGAGHWLTDERPDELAAAPLRVFSEVGG
jgi:pimeloyl-ACP methyl ester carboxylesterase